MAILSGPVRAPAKVGQNLTWGQGLETGRQGLVVIKYADGTRLQLGSGTVIWEASERPGTRGDEGPKRIHLTAGTLTADVAKQPAGRPMILQTLRLRRRLKKAASGEMAALGVAGAES